MLIPIDEPDDPRLEDYRAIRDRDLLGRRDLFIGEQFLVVEKMLSLPGVTRSVLALPQHASRLAAIAPEDIPVFVAEIGVLQQVAGFDIHRGVLAVGHRPPVDNLTIDRALPNRPGPLTVLLCEDIRNIDNMGLLFRNAAAFAVDCVILSPSCHDPLYRKCLRVSIGHALTVPWARSGDWPTDLARLRSDWKLHLVGTSLDPGTVALESLEPPQRVGILMGSEYHGLSRVAQQACDSLVRIRMASGVDSLNVAVASGVFLDRLSRGRRS